MTQLPDSFSLRGRHALVTGSSRGIGRAIALAFAQAGADIVVHASSAADAQAASAVAAARELGVSADYIAADLCAPDAGRELGRRVIEQCGAIDILVLNASAQVRMTWLEITDAQYALQTDVNLRSTLQLLQVLVPPMQQHGWGRVLGIGSVQQRRPHPDMLVYSATKGAMENMLLSLAKQIGGDGVTCNTLAPGVIVTDRNSEALADAAYAERVRQAIPLRDFGQSDDCAGAALLLCSQAGRYITGQTLYVDGGMSL